MERSNLLWQAGDQLLNAPALHYQRAMPIMSKTSSNPYAAETIVPAVDRIVASEMVVESRQTTRLWRLFKIAEVMRQE